MRFERTRNATNTFIFGLIGRLVMTIGPFITRTTIIYVLGAEYAGLSGLFTSVLSVLNISELGIGAAAAFCMYEPVAKDDKNTICALLAMIRKLYYIVGGVILAGGLALMPLLRYLIKGNVPIDINIYWLYFLYLLNSAVSYLGFAYKELLFQAYQRGDVLHRLLIWTNAIKYIAQVIALIFLKSYYAFVAILLLCDIFYTIFVGIRSKKVFPQILPMGNLSSDVRKKFWSKVAFLSVHSVSSKLVNSADNIVLSAFSGLTAITLYGNYNYLTGSILSIILIAYSSIAPAVGNVLCTESKDKLLEIFNSLWLGCTWITVFCTTCFFCLFQPFISTIWLRSEAYLLPMGTVIIICFYFFANAMNQFLTTTYINPAGLWNKTLLRQILAPTINLFLDIILVAKFGVGGVVFASLVASAGISLPYDIVVVYRYILKEKVANGFIKLGKCIIVLMTTVLVSWPLCHMLSGNGIVGFFLQCVVCLVLPNFVIYCVYRRTDEFAFIKDHLLTMCKKMCIRSTK